ncbi:hypothetical protein [Histidinibacterium lentulum]|uniref:Uncharacterized protein n=1 Tax=Histidinibacterium lentulum TaxID=2480588 RepID=A0A3N2R0Z8_9RHOB|nr:hypothetical protein [Histidinibacterium lentulum]ROU01145.1 hypothetical protein EAT49_11520 [Histidinibacterium lentulum]
MSILSKMMRHLRAVPSSPPRGSLSPAELACIARLPLSRAGRSVSMASLFDSAARLAPREVGGTLAGTE